MNFARRAAIAVLVTGAVSASALAQNKPTPPVPAATLVKNVTIPYQRFTLANGLRVLVHTDRKAPIVGVSVWYDVGSTFEPAGKTGFAHLFEHLMFNGSENAPGDFFEPLKQVGATDYNGTTSFDRTNYFETVPTGALDRALFLESDRMGHLLGAVTQGVLDEQRGVVQNEKRQGDNQPYGLVRYKQVEGLFAPESPYGHTTIGSMADLDKASLADVKDWFRGHYAPNNAVLVLAGDIDAATARSLVEKYFGSIARGPDSAPRKAAIPTLAAPRVEVLHDRVATTRLYRMWAVPGLADKESVALDVFASVLGGLSSSRLDNALVRQDKLAVSVSAGNQSFKQVGIFSISVDVRPGVDPALANARLDAVLADLLAKGPTPDEVARVATNSVSGTIASLESVSGKASTLASGELYTHDPDYYRQQLDQLAAETPANVRAVAQKWLTRPAYLLTVAPGARDAYLDATPPVKVVEAPTPPVKGTRGPLPAVSPVADLVFPAVERTRLSNGIELVYARRAGLPLTRAVMSFDAGTAADVAGKLGTEELALNLLDEGTTARSSVQIAEEKERLGAGIGAGRSVDRTTVSLYVPSPNLGGALDLFADIVRNPAFAANEVARVKNQQLAAISAQLTSPAGLVSRVLPRLVYGPAHPYAKSFGAGDPKAVGALTRDDLIAWQRAWLRPDKAKIFIVSDRPLAEIRAALDARFGDWTGSGTPGVKAAASAPVAATPRIVLIDRPQSPQSLIAGVMPTVLKGTDDLLPVTAANDTLGANFLSRVNMDLREKRHWSYGVSGSFSVAAFAAPYVLSAPVQADQTGASITALRDDVAGFLSTDGITQAEFDRTITGNTRSLPGTFETANAVLAAMQNNDLYHRPDDYYATLTRRYRALTRPQLDAAARAALDPAKLIWIVVGDAAAVRPQLDRLGLPVEVVPAASLATAR